MELKKSPKADLERKKGIYLEIGLVVALIITLVAFNIKSYDIEEIEISQRTAENVVDEVFFQTAEDTPPPPEPEQPEVATELVVVENDAEIKNELGIIDASDDANKAQEEFVPVVIEEEVVVEEEEIFQVVEEDPEFPGGMEALYKYLGESIKYPTLAKENNIEGKVYVTFVVEKDGSIANPRILRDIGGGCGQEAIRVVKSMPKWKAGKQRGKNVRVQFNLPVSFKLN
ncbi:MAG: periplasmic protein TonB [bacterium P3]|nr:MAG: periplasmic protein TonB [bacterium P3]KWW42449.1 MAG: periplasmic protein TonB [bacterium F083]